MRLIRCSLRTGLVLSLTVSLSDVLYHTLRLLSAEYHHDIHRGPELLDTTQHVAESNDKPTPQDMVGVIAVPLLQGTQAR